MNKQFSNKLASALSVSALAFAVASVAAAQATSDTQSSGVSLPAEQIYNIVAELNGATTVNSITIPAKTYRFDANGAAINAASSNINSSYGNNGASSQLASAYNAAASAASNAVSGNIINGGATRTAAFTGVASIATSYPRPVAPTYEQAGGVNSPEYAAYLKRYEAYLAEVSAYNQAILAASQGSHIGRGSASSSTAIADTAYGPAGHAFGSGYAPVGYGAAGYGMTGYALSGPKLIGGGASGSVLGNTSIEGATISGATLSGATISGATISGATITGATISGATISGANISGATISGGTLQGGTQLTGLAPSGQTASGISTGYLASNKLIAGGYAPGALIANRYVKTGALVPAQNLAFLAPYQAGSLTTTRPQSLGWSFAPTGGQTSSSTVTGSQNGGSTTETTIIGAPSDPVFEVIKPRAIGTAFRPYMSGKFLLGTYSDINPLLTSTDDVTIKHPLSAGFSGAIGTYVESTASGLTGNVGLWTELEIAFRSAATKEISITPSIGDLTNVDGYTRILTGMWNVGVDLANTSNITPYIGAGIGAASVRSDTYSGDAGAGIGNVAVASITSNDLVAQVLGGLKYSFAENLAIDLGAKYLRTFGTESTGDFGFTANQDIGVFEGTAGLLFTF